MAEYGKKRLKNTSGDPRLVKLDGQDSPVAKNRWKASQSHVVNMLNEKEGSDHESGRNLKGLFKSVARDVIIPSLNSPGNFTENSLETKTILNNKFNEEEKNPAETTTRNTPTSCSRDDFNPSRDDLSSSREMSVPSRDQSSTCDHLNKANDANEQESNVYKESAVNVSKTEDSKTQEDNSQRRASTRTSRARQSVTHHPRDIGSCLNTLDYLKAVLQSSMVSPCSWVTRLGNVIFNMLLIF